MKHGVLWLLVCAEVFYESDEEQLNAMEHAHKLIKDSSDSKAKFVYVETDQFEETENQKERTV